MKLDLSILILNYNSEEYLKKCVVSILSSDLKGINYEIVLIDNKSPKNPKTVFEDLKSKSKNIKLIYNDKNYGFSKGNNQGVSNNLGKYVLFLNPDTFVNKDSLKKVFEFMETNPSVGVCCPRLELVDGSLTSASHRGFPTPWNAFTHFIGLSKIFPKSKLFAGYTKGWLIDSKVPHEVDAISGGFFFVRKTAATQVGWWDEDYFMYGEDIDFCYKLKSNGWKVMFLPEISVTHYHGMSSGIKSHSKDISTADSKTRQRAAKASADAMRIFYSKHYKNKYPGFLNWIVLSAIGVLSSYRMVKHK